MAIIRISESEAARDPKALFARFQLDAKLAVVIERNSEFVAILQHPGAPRLTAKDVYEALPTSR